MFQVKKRDGKLVDFDLSKITTALTKAFNAKQIDYTADILNTLALRVSADFSKKIKDGVINVEDIQDSAEVVLIQSGYVEVAKSYISVPSTKEEGAKLLQEFISVAEKSSSKNEEIENLASAYYLIGTYYREKLDYKKASSKFLLSAQYYASFDKEFSARALYGAIESFDCNSSFADSKQTYLTLKEKYPQSHWTQRAYSVVSEYLE